MAQYAPFNTPTQLDGLKEYINSDLVDVLQTTEIWFDQHTKNRLQQPNKIIILFLTEYNCREWIEPLLSHAKFLHQHTGSIKIYYIFVPMHNFVEDSLKDYREYFTVIFEPLIYTYFAEKMLNIDFKKTEKKLHFLAFNNRASVKRQSLYYLFEKFSLRSKSYFSFRGSLKWSVHKSIEEISSLIVGDHAPWYAKNLDLDQLHKQIPVTIPDDVFGGNDWGQGKNFFYEDTFCSIVTETYSGEKYPQLSEKTFKPLAFYHPFLLDSAAGGLKLLQDLGFKTFSDWWDEDYDSYFGNHRLEAIFHLILEIGNWSTDKINQVYNEMLPVLIHNQNHCINVLPEMYNNVKPQLFEKIKNIVNEKEKLFK